MRSEHPKCQRNPSSDLDSFGKFQKLKITLVQLFDSVYDRLTDLLERCLGGYTLNNNKSLNVIIWSMTSKMH